MPPSSVTLERDGVDRRERRRAATRRAFVDAAVALFERYGYDAVTVDDIASAVHVSARTFHRYFPRKEDVLFSDSTERFEQFRAALVERPADEPVLDAVSGAFVEVLGAVDDLERERERLRLVTEVDSLRAQHLRRLEGWSALIAEAAAQRSGGKPTDPWPSLVGSCSVAVLADVRRRWVAGSVTDFAAGVKDAFAMVTDLARPVRSES
jgi:AcrR family transcriptional regulator